MSNKKNNPKILEAIKKVRIATGLVLMTYVTLHLTNHAIGLISFELVNAVGEIAEEIWRFPPVSIALYGSLVGHFVVTLYLTYQKRTVKMPARDWAQLILGLSIPFLMLGHIMGTRYVSEVYDVSVSYEYILLVTFVLSPVSGIMNATGLVAAWVHGCIGMHMWLSTKKIYSKTIQMYGLIFAVLLPAAALAGYLNAGREVSLLALNQKWLAGFNDRINLSSNAVWEMLMNDTDIVWYVIVALIATTIAARVTRDYILTKRDQTVTIQYVDGPVTKQPKGRTLLEISRNANIPHASVCGGRGRCSTCRVAVLSAKHEPKPPSEDEKKVLGRVKAADNVRLACQMVCEADMEIMLLLPSDATMATARNQEPWSTGQERFVAILFADLRDFTGTSENKLPFDVVYLINQFSRAMGKCVEANNGRIDKFLGDGLMAIFGIESTPEEAAKNALNAAAEMNTRLEQLNQKLKDSIDTPLRMGIGIHTGPVVIGSMGYGASRGLTAIGDTVNTASRLESETKNLKCLVCVSAQTSKLADVNLPDEILSNVEIRGKLQNLDVYAVDNESVHLIKKGDKQKVEEKKRKQKK